MKLSLSTNFDNRLIDEISPYPVFELYGKLPSDYVGGGRSTYMLGRLKKRKFEEHVLYARKKGILFNYLLNAACLNNNETTKKGQREIRKILDWVTSLGIECVTLSNPLLLRNIKKNYPKLKVRVSVFACIDHLQKAQYWQEMGADVICLDGLTVNREFETLRNLRKKLSIELELLANGNCLRSCPFAHTHMNLLAHSSQKHHHHKGFVIDHCFLECSKRKLEDPTNFIKSDWIRPEDIHLYEEMGYHTFKLVERNLPTDILVKRVKAYSERKYEGNLIDLVQPFGHEQGQKKEKVTYLAAKFLSSLGFLLRPSKVNVLKLLTFKKLSEKRGLLMPLKDKQPIYIDNQKLDGFLDVISKRSCRNLSCETCQHCHQYSQKAITIDEGFKKECLSLHKEIDEMLSSGDLWR